ncbi:MAG: tRNA guanosine(34) transglycosylase Tgt [Bacteroidia bacterium]|nr:tRNA guanosine(34) transglycosylase Tgt [Bacteroidia bacterium]
MKFTLETTVPNSAARAGRLQTDHGEILTPIFMPVGTKATVKAVGQPALRDEIKAQIILGNTYHLYLRPGMEVIEGAGGLHKFMHWDGPILTDSGGFQVYSLSAIRNLSEEGAVFKSHVDGSKHLFTPEKVMDIQRQIGSDIMMVLDECTPYPCERKYAEDSMHMTHRWAKRAQVYFNTLEPLYGHSQALFPIVQGSVYPELRRISAETIAEMDFEGNAIGGLSVGEPHDIMYDITQQVCEILPTSKPRYLMGVGTPANLLECIDRGVDMFDCVLPTRNARHGHLYSRHGFRNFINQKYEKDYSPIDPESDLWVDQYYTKAYLRHLLKAKELLGYQIASLHNLHFFLWLVGEARKHILAGDWNSWKKEMVENVSRRL